MGWLEETPDKDAKVALLVALRNITDGKIFVEAERAKLTRMLAKVRLRMDTLLTFKEMEKKYQMLFSYRACTLELYRRISARAQGV